MTVIAALYARVSTDRQTDAGTIGSQLAALRTRIAADGLSLLPAHAFLDDGWSGATLIRPGLERLRDLAAANAFDRLYVHSPDRLARKYAYQVLLLDELGRVGVEVVFLNRELGRSPEDDLLLQVQGMVAEYERATITERCRRGKRYQASHGAVSVLGSAPYGYRYITKAEGGGVARYEIVLEEARVVRDLFAWVGRERLTLGAVARRLEAQGVITRTGKTVWDRGTLHQMLANPAYGGTAAYGKTRNGPRVEPLRRYHGRSAHPHHPVSKHLVPPDDWVSIPVPAIVSPDLVAAVADQLAENQVRARQRPTGQRHLLQGLLCCAHCGYAYVLASSGRRGEGVQRTRYFRCSGTDAHRHGGTRLCTNRMIRRDVIEPLVWQEVRRVLEDPGRLQAEYQRRLQGAEEGMSATLSQQLERERRRLVQGRDRLIDSYAEGLVEPADFTPRITRLNARLAALETQLQDADAAVTAERELRAVMGQLDAFVARMHGTLETADDEAKRAAVRALVKRVEIGREAIHVVFRIPGSANERGPDPPLLHHCRSRSGAIFDTEVKGYEARTPGRAKGIGCSLTER
jgi:site-specific DNA recombinase